MTHASQPASNPFDTEALQAQLERLQGFARCRQIGKAGQMAFEKAAREYLRLNPDEDLFDQNLILELKQFNQTPMKNSEEYTATEIVNIARVCHEANLGWCAANGDHTQKSWNDAEQWQRESAVAGVKFALDNPYAPASAQHDAWSADKIKDGWSFGLMKDAALKQHPCLVPFEELPTFQQKKDMLFKAIVNALK